MSFFGKKPSKLPSPEQLIRVNPQEILFSLPTLNDALPAQVTEYSVPTDAIILHEDDWRQFEFISNSFNHLVDEELADIDEIWKSYSVQSSQHTAFRKLHIRKRIPRPISGSMPISLIENLTQPNPLYLSFGGYLHPLRNVAGTRVAGFALYTASDQGRVHTLGLHREQSSGMRPDEAERIVRFMEEHNLVLVHWPSRKRFPSLEAVAEYLEGKKSGG